MSGQPARRRSRGFTLLEIMIVVAIIALVMTIAIPSIYRQLHPESLQKAVSDLMEGASHARAQAIFGGSDTFLVLNMMSRTVSVSTSPVISESTAPRHDFDSPDVAGNEWRMEDRHGSGGGGGGTGGAEGANFNAKISESIKIEGIRLNFLDYTEDEVIQVRFKPNGTCDEFSVFLLAPDGERRQVFLEVMTGLADVESDPKKFR
jgi:prepilin-type N-terminal cleavage/methylation domain-containing protein